MRANKELHDLTICLCILLSLQLILLIFMKFDVFLNL